METELEKNLMCTYKTDMILFLKSHPEHFKEAIELAISDKQPYSWRSAYLLWSCIEENDARVKKYVKSIIASIKSKNDGHQRELLKILYQMELEEKHEGVLFDICINIWQQINKTPSVRMTALKFIIKIANKHPDLSKEIDLITDEHYLKTLSPGVKRSILKLIKK